MQKMIKKLNLKLIILECFALIFIFSGLNRLFVAYNADLIQALIKEDFDKFDSLTNVSASQFFVNQIYWHIFSLITCLIIIIFINWRYKTGVINSLTVALFTLGISASGFLISGYLNKIFNSFSRLFGSELDLKYFIGGTILILIGVLILWQTIKSKRVGLKTNS